MHAKLIYKDPPPAVFLLLWTQNEAVHVLEDLVVTVIKIALGARYRGA